MDKIMGLAKKLNVLLVIMQVATIAMLVITYLVLMFEWRLFKDVGSGFTGDFLSIGGINFSFAKPLPQDGNFVLGIMIPFVVTTIDIIIVLIGISIFKKIIRPMREGISPFVAGISKYINQLGIVILVGYIVKLSANYYTNLQTVSVLKKVIPKTVVTEITTKPDINLFPIAIILLVFLIASIFKYGEKLQQESDEML